MKRLFCVIAAISVLFSSINASYASYELQNDMGSINKTTSPDIQNPYDGIDIDALSAGSEDELLQVKQNLGIYDDPSLIFSKKDVSYWWNKIPETANISEVDINILRTFYEQKTPSGKSNGEMLCGSSYNKDNPRTWVGTFWRENADDGDFHVVTIVTDPGVLSGSLGISVQLDYELGGIFDMRGLPMLQTVFCGNSGQFSEIILSDVKKLSFIDFSGMKLEGRLHIDGCNELQSIVLIDSDLHSIDLSAFTSLATISCGSNPDMTSLILPVTNTLENLRCEATALSDLDVTAFENLRTLAIDNTGITNIDLSHNPKLATFSCNNTRMDVLDLSGCKDLTLLMCSDSGLRKLVLPKSEEYFQVVICENNYLTEIDTSGNSTLYALSCDNNYLTELDLSDNLMLMQLHCRNNYLTELDMSGNQYLETLRIDNNRISKLTLNKNTAVLWRFTCSYNLLSTLDIVQCLYLTEFDCSYNLLSELDFTGNASYDPYNERFLYNFSYEGNPLVSIKNVPYKNSVGEHKRISVTAVGGGYTYVGNAKDDMQYKSIYAEAVCEGGSFLGWYDGDTLVSSDAKIQLYRADYTNLQAKFSGNAPQDFSPFAQRTFPDKAYYDLTLTNSKVNSTDEENIKRFLEQKDASGIKNGEKLCENYDPDNPMSWDCIAWCEKDGEYRVYGLYFDAHVDYNGNYVTDSSPLVGKLDMTGSTYLHTVICKGQDIVSADFTNCTELKLCDISCCGKLGSLNVQNCKNLLYLNVCKSIVGDIDIYSCEKLMYLDVGYAHIGKLSVAGNPDLRVLKCENNTITELDLSVQERLQFIDCSGNALDKLDVSMCRDLLCLKCSHNKLTDISLPRIGATKKLQSLICDNNSLTSLTLPKCKLYMLDVSHNEITQIENVDQKNTPELLFFYAKGNRLTDLVLDGLPLLMHIDCSDNALNSISMEGCLQLCYLHCENNNLTEISLPDNGTGFVFLHEFDCSKNKLTELDLSLVSENFHMLNVTDNPLISITNAPLGYILSQPIPLNDNSFYRINIKVQGTGYIDYDLDTITAVGENFTGFYMDGVKLSTEPTLSVDGMERCNITLRFSDFLLGDANGNGVFNTADAVHVLKYAAEMLTLTNEQKALADMNEDGLVNTGDATAILNAIANN